jgi:hypothetical protein
MDTAMEDMAITHTVMAITHTVMAITGTDTVIDDGPGPILLTAIRTGG